MGTDQPFCYPTFVKANGAMNSDQKIGVAGAGSIGCFVGGMLAAAGRGVALLARPRVIGEIETSGLRLTSFDGSDHRLASNRLTLSDDPAIFSAAGVVLVTVKSADTAGMADIIAEHAPADAVIVSLQNGVGNLATLRERLPGRRVLGGMVPFNVIALGEGRFHRATSGDIIIERDDADMAKKLSAPGLTMRATANIEGVQWGKLLLNLNNALNALAGLPLRRQLGQRSWRRLFADQMAEGLWRRSGPRASGRYRRRRSRRPGCRPCCGCPMPSSKRCSGAP
jgi:2-dehydropantoate 2-reductase